MLPLLAAALLAGPAGLSMAFTTLMDDRPLVRSLIDRARPALVCMRASMSPETLREVRDLAEAQALDRAMTAAGARCGLGVEIRRAATEIRARYPEIRPDDAAGAAEMLFGLGLHAEGSGDAGR